jgi:indole-3-glycerol phosphate synthase
LIDTIPDILARIVARKREELAGASTTPDELEARARLIQRRDFRAALAGKSPAIIAEIKKASPSKGILTADFHPVRIACQYAHGGAAALSVLTDRSFFQGSLKDLECARAAVGIPVLRKDFTLEEYHVLEAAASGADAILLIAAILDERHIRDLRESAARWGMAALVETHDEFEVDRAIAAGADIIGVNNRNLTNFEVTLETSLRLAERMPSDVLLVSESGIHSRADVERLQAAGFRAFLVGEHLMQARNPATALRALVTPA